MRRRQLTPVLDNPSMGTVSVVGKKLKCLREAASLAINDDLIGCS
jgi:hypothetical protein